MSKSFIQLLFITTLIIYTKESNEIIELSPYQNYHLEITKENPILAFKFRLNSTDNDKADLIIHFQQATGFTVKGLITTNLDLTNCILSESECKTQNNSLRFIVQRKDIIVKIKDLNLTNQTDYAYIIFKDKHYFYEDYVSVYRENDEVELNENQPYLLSRFFSLNYRICTFTVNEKYKYSFEINNFDRDLVTIYTNKSQYKEIYSSDDNLISTIISLFPNKTYYIKITNQKKEKKPYYKNKFLILITKFEGFKPIELKEGKLHFEKFITFNKYFFYFDLSQYKLNEENFITYRFDSINDNINNEIKAVIVTANNTNITDFKQLIPVKDEKSIFTLLESHKYKDNVYHLKFKKTIQKPKEHTLLFISLKFTPKNEENTFIMPDDFEIGIGKRMNLKYLEEESFKYNDKWVEHNDDSTENSVPHFYKFLLNDTNETDNKFYDSDKDKIEKSIIIQSGNGTKVKIQKEENSTIIKEKLSDNTVLLRMNKDKSLILKIESDKNLKNEDNKKGLSFKIFYTNHTIHNLIKPENLKLLSENSPLINDNCVNQSYLITNDKIKHFIPTFKVELLLSKYYLSSLDNTELIKNVKEFLNVKDKKMISNSNDDLNFNQLNCKSIIIYNQRPIHVSLFNNLVNDYSFTIKKDVLLTYDKFLLHLKQMDGNKTKEHKFEIKDEKKNNKISINGTQLNKTNLNDTDFKNIIVNETQLNDTYSNITKEDFTQLIGKNIEEGIYRVEITGFGKKGEKSFIEKYKPINIQIRKIKDNENGFSMNYFVFFIFIITVTLLILLGVIRENKAIIIKQTRENYIELNDDEDEMINI